MDEWKSKWAAEEEWLAEKGLEVTAEFQKAFPFPGGRMVRCVKTAGNARRIELVYTVMPAARERRAIAEDGSLHIELRRKVALLLSDTEVDMRELERSQFNRANREHGKPWRLARTGNSELRKTVFCSTVKRENATFVGIITFK